MTDYSGTKDNAVGFSFRNEDQKLLRVGPITVTPPKPPPGRVLDFVLTIFRTGPFSEGEYKSLKRLRDAKEQEHGSPLALRTGDAEAKPVLDLRPPCRPCGGKIEPGCPFCHGPEIDHRACVCPRKKR